VSDPRRLALALALVALPALAAAEAPARRRIAERPPMGWNSWNCFGVTVTEAQVKANARYMAEHLRSSGWEYVVVDLGWYLPPALDTSKFKMESPAQATDAFGRLVPDVRKFPSASGGRGFRPLADQVHGLGLKFGIHIMRGIPWQAEKQATILGTKLPASSVMDKKALCDWYAGMYGVDTAKPGGQAYYDSLVALYASWGVDFIKADDMSRPYHEGEIAALSKAIARSPRPIALSLSPGATSIERAEHVKAYANMWRISPDFWDLWRLLDRQFTLCRQWQAHVGPGHWPDADMLPLGKLRVAGGDDYVAEQMGLKQSQIANEYSRFTDPEKYTLMTLWSIFRSPLMIGGHLPENDPMTLQLLTNDEVIAVDQRSRNNREVLADGDRVVWAAEPEDGSGAYVALFNRGEKRILDVEVTLAKLGVEGPVAVRNLWTRSNVGETSDLVRMSVASHGAALLKLTPKASKAAASPSATATQGIPEGARLLLEQGR
jgi:alpha-galactosidase